MRTIQHHQYITSLYFAVLISSWSFHKAYSQIGMSATSLLPRSKPVLRSVSHAFRSLSTSHQRLKDDIQETKSSSENENESKTKDDNPPPKKKKTMARTRRRTPPKDVRHGRRRWRRRHRIRRRPTSRHEKKRQEQHVPLYLRPFPPDLFIEHLSTNEYWVSNPLNYHASQRQQSNRHSTDDAVHRYSAEILLLCSTPLRCRLSVRRTSWLPRCCGSILRPPRVLNLFPPVSFVVENDIPSAAPEVGADSRQRHRRRNDLMNQISHYSSTTAPRRRV